MNSSDLSKKSARKDPYMVLETRLSLFVFGSLKLVSISLMIRSNEEASLE